MTPLTERITPTLFFEKEKAMVHPKEKRKDECFKCNKRICCTRILRTEEPKYDKIACSDHINDLEKDADATLGVHNGIIRRHISSSEKLRVGDVMRYD